jgi:hypothetical protein
MCGLAKGEDEGVEVESPLIVQIFTGVSDNFGRAALCTALCPC